MRPKVHPGLTSWVILSRPGDAGTDLAGNVHPALRAGLFSAVPSGLLPIHPEGWFVFSKCCPNRPIKKSQFAQVRQHIDSTIQPVLHMEPVPLPDKRPAGGVTARGEI
jgi:hypothetical protein